MLTVINKGGHSSVSRISRERAEQVQQYFDIEELKSSGKNLLAGYLVSTGRGRFIQLNKTASPEMSERAEIAEREMRRLPPEHSAAPKSCHLA